MIADRIRKKMDQPNGLTVEAMTPLAAEYSQEVSQANARLADAVHLLRKGLRSEAIQRASMQPNVLDWSSSLDFPELDDWIDILQFLSIDPPPLPDRDSAQELQEAIIDEQPLEDLLRQHRRLAIAKAPLPWRIKVLRRIKDVDAINPVWAESLESWEAVRLKQVPKELAAAIEAASLPACSTLAAEICSDEWLIRPPAELVQKAQGAAAKLVYRDQLTKLEAIAESLHSAYSAADEVAARAKRSEWQATLSGLRMPPPVELTQMVEPALEWLSQEDDALRRSQQHDQAVARLSSAIADGSSEDKLQRLFFDVQQFDLGLDPVLRQRYDVRLSELQLKSKRRIQFAFFAASLTAACLVGILFFWQSTRSFERARISASSQLQAMLDASQLNEAKGYWDQLEQALPKVAAAPSVAALGVSLKEQLTREEERRRRWEQLISQAASDDPATIDLSLLSSAEQITSLPEEKARTEEIRRSADRYRRQLEQERYALLKTEVDKIESLVSTVESARPSEESVAQLDNLIGSIRKLQSDYRDSGTQGTKLVDFSLRRTEGLRNDVDRQNKKAKDRSIAIDAVQRSDTIQAYRQSIERFAQAFPDDPMGHEFQDAVQEAVAWETPFSWNAWSASLRSGLATGLSSTSSQALAADLAKLNDKVSIDLVSSSLPSVAAALELNASRAALLSPLVDDLRNSPITDLVTAVGEIDKQTQRVFMYQAYKLSEEDLWKKLTDRSRSGVEVVTEVTGEVGRVGINGKIAFSPHPRKWLLELIGKFDEDRTSSESRWDESMLEVVQVCMQHPEVDHHLKAMVLGRVLTAAGSGSGPLRDAFRESQRLLLSAQQEQVNWARPEPFTAKLPAELQKALEEGLRSAKAAAKQERESFARLSNLQFEWVGAIQRDAAGTAVLWTRRDPLQDGILVTAIRRPDSADAYQIERVGSVREGLASIDRIAAQIAGRPIFLATVRAGTAAP